LDIPIGGIHRFGLVYHWKRRRICAGKRNRQFHQPIWLTAARRTLTTTRVFTSGSGADAAPANVLSIEVELVGGGAAGSGFIQVIAHYGR
jgi:hypothetical protein